MFENIEHFGTDVGWFGGDFGMVRGYFREGFGPTLKNQKIGGPELNKIALNDLK